MRKRLFEFTILKHSDYYPIIKSGLDLVPPIRGLQSFGSSNFYWFFKGSCFVLTFLCYIISGFTFVSLVVSFSQKSNYFCFGFVLRLFGVL